MRAMTHSKDTSAVNKSLSIYNKVLEDVHTKQKDSAVELVAMPEKNTSKLDHEVVMEVVEGANPNFEDVSRERVREDVERTGDVVVQNIKELPRGGDKNVLAEIPDGKANIFVVSRNGDPVKIVVSSSDFPQTKLNQIALTFCAQLGAVFVGNALNRSSSSCSCAPSASASRSHSDFSEWIAVTVTVTNLIGFVFTLIAVSLENQNQKSPPTKKRNVSSVVAKFGLAAVASAIIVSMGAVLPLNINGNLAFTAIASLPSLIAVASA